MLSITEQVKIYIKKKPYVREALEQDIINFSALSRHIAGEIPEAKFDAVKAALMRIGCNFRKEKQHQEKHVIQLLDNSNFSIQNKISVVRSKVTLNIDSIAETKTPSGYVYVLPQKSSLKIKDATSIENGMSAISITSPQEITNVPGVMAFLYSALASENINICETLSCREDTIIVVYEHDAPLAFSTLAEKMRI